ncbi:MAG TPA: hypothetical protein VL972_08715 [Solirubrobacteraceae bacterium]|nr:hypothetical protein [Solirubrobacteraceae bacterium]
MLFDLRGRGRRRTVQVIYLGLALLIGAGLVFFGVGAGVGGGGLLSSLTGSEGSSSASFAAQIEKYKKLAKKNPRDLYAWEQLTLAQLHEAGGEAYVTRSGELTSKGRELFSQTASSWNSYIALNPKHPNATLAQEVVRIFGEEGLDNPAEAVKVLQIVIAAKHGSTAQYQATLYSELAEYAYKAGNTGTGDLAAAKAVAMAPTAQRARLKKELEEIKKHPKGPEYTTTVNGKPVKVQSAGHGTFTATESVPKTTTSTQPGGLSSGTK